MEKSELTIVAKKCGIRFTSPALILVYEDVSKKNKLRKYIMPIRKFKDNSNASFVAENLKLRHKTMLECVSTIQIEKMLRILQEHLKGNDINQTLETVNKEFTVNADEDLNKLGDDEIRRKKKIMDWTFNKNHIKPDDINFIQKQKIESGWDEEESDDLFWN
ncbi:hypothetical protein L9F63_005586 [Diploptera punctata]|uniref:Centrosomal protein of 19 kDa n=1 Tax=Diploptera punctata TaxID=6984 RepID=A0AAD7ZD90_DIPPU|nr:hypothetical protein L9F63_005586 [Diploptera punctata]